MQRLPSGLVFLLNAHSNTLNSIQMPTLAVPVWTEMKVWIKQRGWLMHLACWSTQTQMCPKYLMQTIPASHYPESCSQLGVSHLFHIHPFSSHTDKLQKHMFIWPSFKRTLCQTVTPRLPPVVKILQLPAISGTELLSKQTRINRKWALPEKHRPGRA